MRSKNLLLEEKLNANNAMPNAKENTKTNKEIVVAKRNEAVPKSGKPTTVAPRDVNIVKKPSTPVKLGNNESLGKQSYRNALSNASTSDNSNSLIVDLEETDQNIQVAEADPEFTV